MLRVAVVLALLVVSSGAYPQSGISGAARVVDGDTIVVGETSIRLYGIDAPERDQGCLDASGNAYACGINATVFLIQIIGLRDVNCDVRGRDRYRRTVAVCYAGPTNLNSALVRSGWAVAYRRYSAEFVQEEELARRERKGMWAGRFNSPEDWRHTKR